MLKNVYKITTIIIPTFIITSPVSALDCDLASSEINVSNKNLVKIPYEDGLKSLMPDSYVCPKSCNTCSFEINKFDSYYQISGGSCTLVGCGITFGPKNQKQINYKLCFENWIFSERLIYNDLPSSLNQCINGYRNITYVNQQKKLDRNISLEDSKTLEHTRIALSKGIPNCKKLFKYLAEKGRFNEREISYFSMYLHNRYFLNPFRYCFSTAEQQTNDLSQLCLNSLNEDHIKSQKVIFNYLSNNFDRTNRIIISEMIEQFEQEYEEYLTDKRANRRKKISEFWQKILDFIKF